MKTLKPIITTIASTLAMAGAPTAFGGDAEYQLVIIAPWNTGNDQATSKVSGLNNHNVVSGCASALSGPCSFLWTLEDGKSQVNLGGVINDNGIVVGGMWLRWPDGTLQQLQDAEGYSVNGLDINNSNVVAGAWGATSCEANSEAALWHPEDGSITLFAQELGIFAADQLRAVNENNRVVGMVSVTGECGDYEAFYYDFATGEFIDLHALLTGGESGVTEMFDLNDSDLALGHGPHEATTAPFLWSSEGGFQFLPAPAGALTMNTHLVSLNNHSTAVGWAIVDGDGERGIIWDEVSGTRDLNDLIGGAAPPDFVIDKAHKINDNGWIIGSGHYGSWSPARAVVLIPVESPTTGDLNGDGVVDGADLAILLGAWGACSDCDDCNGDLNSDCTVDGGDLAVLLGNWG